MEDDAGSPPRSAKTGIVVGGYVAAQLLIESRSAEDDLLSAAANRLSEVLALALAQSFRPSADQIAEGRLVQAVLDGASRTAVGRLWAGTLLAPGPACVVLALPLGLANAHEAVLRRAAPRAAAGAWGRGRALLVPLAGPDPLERRTALVGALAESVDGSPVRCAVGPLVWDGTNAHESFTEARTVLDEAAEQPGVVDVAAQFGAASPATWRRPPSSRSRCARRWAGSTTGTGGTDAAGGDPGPVAGLRLQRDSHRDPAAHRTPDPAQAAVQIVRAAPGRGPAGHRRCVPAPRCVRVAMLGADFPECRPRDRPRGPA